MKSINKLLIIILFVTLCGFFTFSCTDGESYGTGDAGNFTVVNIATEYEGKYLAVSATISAKTVSFNNPERIKITGGKVKAPLYFTDDKTLYTGSDTVIITARIYESNNTTTHPAHTMEKVLPSAVKFYSGSAVASW